MTKTYILDTNVLLSDPGSLLAFENSEIILPFTVIEEIDGIKKRPNEVGANAREIARNLSELISENETGALKRGIKLKNGSTLRVVSSDDVDKKYFLSGDWDEKNKDNHILQVCKGLVEAARERGAEHVPTLITRDIVLRVKCDFLGIPCEDYKKETVAENPDRLFSGVCFADNVPPEVLQSYWEELATETKTDFNFIVDSYVDHALSPNEFVILRQNALDEGAAVRYMEQGKPVRFVKEHKRPIFNVLPRNKEQNFALELLLDPEVKMVTLIGRAGSGKTICSIAAGLNQVLEKKRYKSLVVCRPVVPVGNDIGFLPGPVPLHTNVLTPNGWVKMGDIEKNSYVIAKDGKPTKVLETFAKGKKEIIEITFEDGAKVECCEDHPWAVYSTNRAKPKVVSTKYLEKIQNEIGWNEKWRTSFSIDLVSPVNFAPSTQELPIHPYILGSILGNGYISGKHSCDLLTADLELVARINSFLGNDSNDLVLQHKSGSTYSFIMKENLGNRGKGVKNKLTEAINSLGLRGTSSNTKLIPKQYLFSSVEDRFLLLRGIMDTAGYCSADGHDVSCTTTSSALANDVKALVMSLGGMAKIKYSKNKRRPHTVFVSFDKQEYCPFSLSRKANIWKPRRSKMLRRIESVKRTGVFAEMKCISIENPEHLYVMDHFVVTHNTKEEKLEPWIAPIKDNLRYLLFSGRKSKNAEQTLQGYFDDGVIEVEAITYLRGRSIADAFIIIDEAQNLTAHELKTIITRVGENTKIVLTGDIEQIDNIYIDSLNNGLTIAVEKFRKYPIAGHVTLIKGERSALASLAARIL
jgi:predicted ribonuclease YlaK